MHRQWITVEEAIPLSGLRVAFAQGVPGPWGQAVREILQLKKIPFVPVIQTVGAPNEALAAWTGQNSAPCAVLDNERPRSHWSEMLLLAERLGPEPRLIPADEHLRMAMFGIVHEICGEDGFGWHARLIMMAIVEQGGAAELAAVLRRKFDSGSSQATSIKRSTEIMRALADRLERQNAAGSSYLVGDRLSAADIYWTVFSNMVAPMRHEDCPMPDNFRSGAEACAHALDFPVPALLLEHRERILHEHLSPPLWF